MCIVNDRIRYIDFLAKLGVDYAHPGGRRLTEAIVADEAIRQGASVLDVGCGTGATTQLLAEEKQASVTGIDVHPEMVERAKKRAAQSAIPFKIVLGSAESLPFHDHSFDWLLSESVTAFTDTWRALPEYYRVLRPGGTVTAIEMTTERPLSERDSRKICGIYGVRRLYTADDWKELWRDAGFSRVRVFKETDFLQAGGKTELPSFPMTEQLGENMEDLFDVWLDHMNTMRTYGGVLSYRIYRAEKPAHTEK